MKDCVMRITNLTKKYNQTLALDDVSITLKKGKIYGFIGQNGAGKTTLIRIITGLSFPDKGQIEMFGENGQKGLEKARRSIGCMVEHTALYPNLSAQENLELQRKLKGISDKDVINRVLKIVGLEDTKKKKFKNFSMGMKQRLGIAAALIGDPEFLILDEPINGLDPVGIVEIREMLLKLNNEYNITILISSHILGELYTLATDYIIINKGKIVDTFTLEQLDEKCKNHIVIEPDNVEHAKTVLKNKLIIEDYIQTKDNRIKIFDENIDRKSLAKAFYKAGVILTELSCSGKSLESYFIDIIGGNHNE